MSSAYLTLWSQPQVEVTRRSLHHKDTLDHTANDQFRSRGVTPGDRVYVVATGAGRLLLLGRMTVDRVVDQDEAERLLGDDIYEAADHLIGRGSSLRLDRVVPERVARELQRESGKRLKIAPDAYLVDVHSLRTTGRITEASAALLDTLLDGGVRIETDGPLVREGNRQQRRHQVIERSNALRTLAFAVQGTACKVCGFSFAATYGVLGEDFAEVHHLTPLSKLTSEALIDPATDVVVLCSNCHRMVHRDDPPITPDELRKIVMKPR